MIMKTAPILLTIWLLLFGCQYKNSINQETSVFVGCDFYRPHMRMYAKQEWFDLHPLSGIQLPKGVVKNDMAHLVYFGKRERRPLDAEAPGLWTHDWIEANDKWEEVLQACLASTSAWVTFIDHHCLKTERWRYIRYSFG